MTSLKSLTDDSLYIHLINEVGELRDAVDELRFAITKGRRMKITDALDSVGATLRRVTALRDELAARGILK